MHKTESLFDYCADDEFASHYCLYSFIFSTVQVKKLAFLFKLDSETVYLVEEIGNTAIFPNETGRFRTTQISPGTTYEVHGEPMFKGQQYNSVTSAQPTMPYIAPTVISTQQPPLTPTYQPNPTCTRVSKKAIR